MKHEFETILKGDDIELSSLPTTNDEDVKSVECKIKWSIDPQIENWGIRYWRPIITTFECTITINSQEEDRTVVINSICMYDCEIVEDNYKMPDDYTITRIEINREKEKATAFIQS